MLLAEYYNKNIFTEEELTVEAIKQIPEWIMIYFEKLVADEMKCNLCDIIIKADESSPLLMEHMQEEHKDMYDLHKDNPEATVGFRIEFLNLNVLKDNKVLKSQPVILGEVCETTSDSLCIEQKEDDDNTVKEDNTNLHYVLLGEKKKPKRDSSAGPRKRSWIWKYFEKLSNIIYRCKLCNVVLSIKGCNSNNMNRHVRTRHPVVFKSEATKKENRDSISAMLSSEDTNAPYAIKTEEIYASELDMDADNKLETSVSHKMRRSWIWSYFDRVSTTQAQCKLCKRQICHGGNATGNMNRHLKMIHHKTAMTLDQTWVWKVFDNGEEEEFYSCKICQHKCMKYADIEKSMISILCHLKSQHGVVSGDQIITGTDMEGDEN